jgi:predicted negative regulator of RcsB-dependent stress response
MSEATKRFRRKDLRSPDEFVTLTNRVVKWSRENTRLAVGAGIGLGLVVVVATAWSWIATARAERAAREFYAADELFRRDQWDAAETAFDALAEDLPGTTYGRLGRLYAGRAAQRGGDPTEAERHFREFLARPVSDTALVQLAHMNLGAVLAAQNQLDAARDELNLALAMDGPARDEVTLELARVEEVAGRNDQALELYQRYLVDEPNGVARDLARARILALGGTPPALPPTFPGGRAPSIAIQ